MHNKVDVKNHPFLDRINIDFRHLVHDTTGDENLKHEFAQSVIESDDVVEISPQKDTEEENIVQDILEEGPTDHSSAHEPKASNKDAFDTFVAQNVEDMELQEPYSDLADAPSVEEVKVAPHTHEEARCLEVIRELCSPTVIYSLCSEQWVHRKEGLELIQKYVDRCGSKLEKMPMAEIIDEFYAVAVILRKFFDDRVAPVYFAAYDCFRALLKVYGHYVSGERVEQLLRSMVTPLLTSMGGEATGTNRRTQKEACRCVLRVARLTHLDGLGVIIPLLSDEAIPLRPRLALLKLLVQEFRIETSSNGNCGSAISADLVMGICQPALANADDKVRKAAVDNIGIAYGMVGKMIKTLITDVKPAMLKVLETKFAEIDGIEPPPSASRQESVKKPKTKKGLGRKSSGGGENILNLAPLSLKKGSSFSRHDSFNKGAVFGNGGMECEIYVKERKEVHPSMSPQHNSPDDGKTTKPAAYTHSDDLEGINRKLFIDSFGGDDYGNAGSQVSHAKPKKGASTPNKGSNAPGHPSAGLDSRFVISESVC